MPLPEILLEGDWQNIWPPFLNEGKTLETNLGNKHVGKVCFVCL